MSVASPVISHIDGTTRRIYLNESVSDFYPIEDIYHEYRRLRALNTDGIRKYNAILRAEGNVSKGGGAYTPRYVVLLEDAKIVPYNEVLQLNQLGDMITDDADNDPTLYDTTTLTVPKVIYIKPSESETIQLNSEAIVYSSFNGAVWLDSINGEDNIGTATLPNGNQERPVVNAPLALEVCTSRGFRTINVLEDYGFVLGDDISKKHVNGVSHIATHIDVGYDAICSETVFSNLNITGVLDGHSEINNCVVGDIVYFNGHVHNSALGGTIYLGGNNPAKFVNCSMSKMTDLVELDCGGSGQDCVMDYKGIITISNLTGDNKIGLNMNGGIVTVASDCTAGAIIIQGNFELIDNSGVGCTVITSEKLMVYDDIADIAHGVLYQDANCGDTCALSVGGADGTEYIYENDWVDDCKIFEGVA